VEYVIAFVINGVVIDLTVNPRGTMPRHTATLDMIERGTGEWDYDAN
jgi:hypothetical protein